LPAGASRRQNRVMIAAGLALWIALMPGVARADVALEDLLRQARATAGARAQALEPSLRDLAARVEGYKPSQSKELAEARTELLRLGREVAALLVPYLEPGARDDDGTRRRAQLVRDVLHELRSRAALDGLLALARTGSLTARRHALHVLGTCEERPLALATLLAAARDALPAIRAAALGALAELGGDEAVAAVRAGLADPEAEVLRAVLSALAESPDTSSAAQVAALLAEPRAQGAARECLAYYSTHRELASALVCQRLLALCAQPQVESGARLAILDTLPSFRPLWSAELRKVAEPLLASDDAKLRVEAQVCLARLGDKVARKDLKREADDAVQRNPSWAQAWTARARLLLRLEEFDSAQRDFKKALELYEKSNRNLGEEREARIGLARAYALDKRLKDAGATLEQAGLTPDELRKLSQDPDFAELAASSKWGKILSGW